MDKPNLDDLREAAKGHCLMIPYYVERSARIAPFIAAMEAARIPKATWPYEMRSADVEADRALERKYTAWVTAIEQAIALIESLPE